MNIKRIDGAFLANMNEYYEWIITAHYRRATWNILYVHYVIHNKHEPSAFEYETSRAMLTNWLRRRERDACSENWGSSCLYRRLGKTVCTVCKRIFGTTIIIIIHSWSRAQNIGPCWRWIPKWEMGKAVLNFCTYCITYTFRLEPTQQSLFNLICTGFWCLLCTHGRWMPMCAAQKGHCIWPSAVNFLATNFG